MGKEIRFENWALYILPSRYFSREKFATVCFSSVGREGGREGGGWEEIQRQSSCCS